MLSCANTKFVSFFFEIDFHFFVFLQFSAAEVIQACQGDLGHALTIYRAMMRCVALNGVESEAVIQFRLGWEVLLRVCVELDMTRMIRLTANQVEALKKRVPLFDSPSGESFESYPRLLCSPFFNTILFLFLQNAST